MQCGPKCLMLARKLPVTFCNMLGGNFTILHQCVHTKESHKLWSVAREERGSWVRWKGWGWSSRHWVGQVYEEDLYINTFHSAEARDSSSYPQLPAHPPWWPGSRVTLPKPPWSPARRGGGGLIWKSPLTSSPSHLLRKQYSQQGRYHHRIQRKLILSSEFVRIQPITEGAEDESSNLAPGFNEVGKIICNIRRLPPKTSLMQMRSSARVSSCCTG